LDKKWKNLVLLIVVCVAIGFFLFTAFLPEQNTFEKKYDKFSNAWKKEGFNRVRFHSSLPALEQLSIEKLKSIKANISSDASSSSDSALMELSNVYVALTDYIIAKKEFLSAKQAIPENPTNSCDYLQEFKSLANASEKLFNASQEYIALANAFVSSYPKEAEFLEMHSTESTASKEDLQKLKEKLASLEEVCA